MILLLYSQVGLLAVEKNWCCINVIVLALFNDVCSKYLTVAQHIPEAVEHILDCAVVPIYINIVIEAQLI